MVRWQGVGMTDRPARISHAEIELAIRTTKKAGENLFTWVKPCEAGWSQAKEAHQATGNYVFLANVAHLTRVEPRGLKISCTRIDILKIVPDRFKIFSKD